MTYFQPRVGITSLLYIDPQSSSQLVMQYDTMVISIAGAVRCAGMCQAEAACGPVFMGNECLSGQPCDNYILLLRPGMLGAKTTL